MSSVGESMRKQLQSFLNIVVIAATFWEGNLAACSNILKSFYSFRNSFNENLLSTDYGAATILVTGDMAVAK